MLDRRFPATVATPIDGVTVEVAVRVSARARSYRLSIPHGRGPVLTVPRHGRWTEAQAFLARNSNWLAARLRRAPAVVALEAGARIPVRGTTHLVVAAGGLRGRVRAEAGEDGPSLAVPGAPEHRARRLRDWLKGEAERDLRAAVAIHAGTLGVTVRAISLRDQSTRWGSCSSAGRLNFNWRLILAPPFVLDYVAAHEVAHRLEMNHSPAFWATVRRTCPEMERGRAWLRAHGSELMAYGREA